MKPCFSRLISGNIRDPLTIACSVLLLGCVVPCGWRYLCHVIKTHLAVSVDIEFAEFDSEEEAEGC